MMREDVRKKLIKTAKERKTVTYGDLMREFKISRGPSGKGIGNVVGTISEYEHQNGRPILSAIVVRSGSGTKKWKHGHPGGGFFGLPSVPHHLRRFESDHVNPNLSDAELEHIKQEQQKVWDYWQTHSE